MSANFNGLQTFLDSLTNEMGIPGCSIAVYREHKPLFKYSSGYADREIGKKMMGNELFYLYSTSKVITCACALTLLEKGRFLLNEPLYRYLPEFEHMKVKVKSSDGKEELVPAKRQILIRDLFTMSAGLDYNLSEKNLVEAIEKFGRSISTRDAVRAMAKRPLCFEPGERWQYSLCHDVLGALIEVVSGMSFEDYLKQSILLPCGMKNTGFFLDGSRDAILAKQYRFNYDEKKAYPCDGNIYRLGKEYASGGAGIISSVDDYILFADAMANGGVAANGNRILSPLTIELMRTNCLDEKAMPYLNWEVLKGYGYGLGVRTMMKREVGGIIGSVGEFGWGGAAGAYALIDPSKKLSVFYAQHMLNNLEPYVHPRIRNIVYSEVQD